MTMMTRISTLALMCGLILTLTSSIAGATGRSGIALVGFASERIPAVPAQQSTCSAMKATTDAYWLATDEDGDATDEEISSYPSGTLAIAAAFEYNCIPKNATIVTVFALDGEVVYSDKEPQKPSNRGDTYSFVISREDGEPVPDGEWEVGFFNNKTLLTSSTIVVGGDASGEEPITDSVTVQGTVSDAKTKKPIKGAVVVVLNEGVTAQQFLKNPKDSMVFVSATTDSRGQFVLETPIERSIAHSWVIAAKGYKPLIEDDLVVGDEAGDPLELNVTLSK
jgi:hypothetical protein